MRLIQRAAITVTSKKPYIIWANSLEEDGVKIDEDFQAERHTYQIGDVADVIPFDRDVIVQPYFKMIFRRRTEQLVMAGKHLALPAHLRNLSGVVRSGGPVVVSYRIRASFLVNAERMRD